MIDSAPSFRRYSICLALLAWLPIQAAPPPAIADSLILAYREITISAPVRGSLETIQAGEGEIVPAGATLATLESSLERLEVDRTQRIFERKEFDHQATQKLFEEKMTSADEALEKRIEANIASIDHDKAQAELKLKSIRAPLDGIVVTRHKEVGEWVEPGQPLFDLVSIDQVYAQLLLPAEQAFRLAKGQSMAVFIPELPAPNRFTGVIDFIAPVVDASSNLVRVKILLPNPDRRIRPGLRGEVLLDQP